MVLFQNHHQTEYDGFEIKLKYYSLKRFLFLTPVLSLQDVFFRNTFYLILYVLILPVFCAVYQGGLFGLSGMMPPRYTQALMTGQGIGGIFACVADIGSKLGTDTKNRNF